jgi:hypothetical protein
MSEEELQRRLRAHRFELARQRKHRVYKNPAGQTFVLPSTPSDQRWSTIALAELARLCGPIETDSRPLRARRQHAKLDIEPPPSIEALPSPAAPVPAAPPLSRADQQRLKRWEKHESQRGAKFERRLVKLRDLAYRMHDSLKKGGGNRGLLIFRLTQETHRRVRALGFQDVALSVADVTEESDSLGVALYVRVGGRFVDILEGALREGQTWADGDGATVTVWADLQPSDFAELDWWEKMYLGSGCVNPSTFRLELKIPDGQAVELALFQTLLSYAEGAPTVILVNGGEYLMHGHETLKAAAEGAGVESKVIYLEGDAEEISRAFNAEDCHWPELLEAGRQNFVEGSPHNESYVAWLEYEIERRGGDAKAA